MMLKGIFMTQIRVIILLLNSQMTLISPFVVQIQMGFRIAVMDNFKKKQFLLLMVIFFTNNLVYCQSFLNRFSFKVGYSLSVTQLGESPFSETRRLNDRSINSVSFNMQFLQPIQKETAITIGIQTVQKGFRNNVDEISPGAPFQFVKWDEYQLNYIEVPINYIFTFSKNFTFIGGIVFSYLYENTYRHKEEQIVAYVLPPTYYEINDAGPYVWKNRFNKFDFGVNAGISRKIVKHFELELSVQRHFINVDNWNTQDLRYNLSFLLGVRYYLFAK